MFKTETGDCFVVPIKSGLLAMTLFISLRAFLSLSSLAILL